MGNSEFDDVAAHLLEPEESLDSEQTGVDLDEGYSPPEGPRELGAWGLTANEARTHESLARRLAREVPDVTDRWDGDRYQARFDALAARGEHVHGEADFVAAYEPASVLDAGCGTGRVGRELARRSLDVVGVDLDDTLLQTRVDRLERVNP